MGWKSLPLLDPDPPEVRYTTHGYDRLREMGVAHEEVVHTIRHAVVDRNYRDSKEVRMCHANGRLCVAYTVNDRTGEPYVVTVLWNTRAKHERGEEVVLPADIEVS